MVVFPKDKLDDAHARLKDLGFEVQHQRILRYRKTLGGTEFQCMVGFESETENLFEANFSFMKRPVTPGEKVAQATNIQVISRDDLPDDINQVISKAENELSTL